MDGLVNVNGILKILIRTVTIEIDRICNSSVLGLYYCNCLGYIIIDY